MVSNVFAAAKTKVALVLIATAILMAGCSTRHYKWTDDVDLGDGRTIEIEREVRFKFSLPGAGGTAVAEETYAAIRFTWQLRKLPVWQQPLRALELYQDLNNEWVVVATTTSCDVWERRGKPKPSYWEFRLRDRKWTEVPLSTASIGRTSNLFFEYFDMKLRHVTVEQKAQIQLDPRIGRKYRMIWGDPDMYVCGERNHNKV